MIQNGKWFRRLVLTCLAATGPVLAQPVGFDFDDDGYSDYPVSIISFDATNPDVGAVRIWSGASKTVIYTIVGTETNTLFGWSSGSAGDLDGDGHDDLIVGEPLWGLDTYQDRTYRGRIHVISGDDASTLLTVDGPTTDAALGRYVTGVGDWDGDGTVDLASSGWDIVDTDTDGIGDDPIGAVFVFSGDDGSLLTTITDPIATTGFGYSIYALGDVSGDGLDDIAIVDQLVETSPGSGILGRLYIFEGSSTATSYDTTHAYRTIANTNASVRRYAAQVDVMHPDLWQAEPTLQVLSLTENLLGGVNSAQFETDILQINGLVTGGKGTRPSLVLSGDVDLDGDVDAADLQVSISQLGSNPQALGVMPIADSNADTIIDSADVDVVVGGYGQSTDIYEGLWDGSRLLSVAAGSAGFGSTAGISPNGPYGGSTNYGGGRRPLDDCIRREIPDDDLDSLVPILLHADAQNNCSECPEYEDTPTCYYCESDKGISGGSVTASPSQPGPNEAVTFTASGVAETPGLLKCEELCGDDEKTAATPLGDPTYWWQVITKGEDGWPEEADPNTFGVIPDDSEITVPGGAVCTEIRAICWAKPSGPCAPTPRWTRVGSKEVSFADFEIETMAAASWPDQNRSTFGPHERIEIRIDQPSLVGLEVVVSWDEFPVANEDFGALGGSDIGIWVKLPYDPGNYEIIIRRFADQSCYRTKSVEVIAPNDILMIQAFSGNVAASTCGNAYQGLQIQLLPLTVNFQHLKIAEGSSTPALGTGSFEYKNGDVHTPTGPLGRNSVTVSNNIVVAIDLSGKVARPDEFGNFAPLSVFAWTIDVNMTPAEQVSPVPVPVVFTAVTSSATSDATGWVCVVKHSAGPACHALGSGGPNQGLAAGLVSILCGTP